MKKFLTIVALTVFSLGLAAQNWQDGQLEQLLEKASDYRVSLDYECSLSGFQPVKLKGRIVVEGDCYYADGNGIRIYCDGKTRWTIDPDVLEVYIEDAGGLAEVLLYRDKVTNIKVSNVKYSEKSAERRTFTFDTSTLNEDWLITDLRGL